MKYRTIVADPPWPVQHTGGKVKAAKHAYNCGRPHQHGGRVLNGGSR